MIIVCLYRGKENRRVCFEGDIGIKLIAILLYEKLVPIIIVFVSF